jgi:EAL domain-containing protein (putative c-di-GMP-specific phosphodiesterase class I)
VAQPLHRTPLELELTEGGVIAESDSAVATLENLKALGLHLAIDDFGTGYSALSRLRAPPFDTLKVDKVFVDELAAANPGGGALADTILDMARVRCALDSGQPSRHCGSRRTAALRPQ